MESEQMWKWAVNGLYHAVSEQCWEDAYALLPCVLLQPPYQIPHNCLWKVVDIVSRNARSVPSDLREQLRRHICSLRVTAEEVVLDSLPQYFPLHSTTDVKELLQLLDDLAVNTMVKSWPGKERVAELCDGSVGKVEQYHKISAADVPILHNIFETKEIEKKELKDQNEARRLYTSLKKVLSKLKEPAEWLLHSLLMIECEVHGSDKAASTLATHLSAYPHRPLALRLALHCHRTFLPASTLVQAQLLKKLVKVCPFDLRVLYYIDILLKENGVNDVDGYVKPTSIIETNSDSGLDEEKESCAPASITGSCFLKSEKRVAVLLECLEMLTNLLQHQEFLWEEKPWAKLSSLLSSFYGAWLRCWWCPLCKTSRKNIRTMMKPACSVWQYMVWLPLPPYLAQSKAKVLLHHMFAAHITCYSKKRYLKLGRRVLNVVGLRQTYDCLLYPPGSHPTLHSAFLHYVQKKQDRKKMHGAQGEKSGVELPAIVLLPEEKRHTDQLLHTPKNCISHLPLKSRSECPSFLDAVQYCHKSDQGQVWKEEEKNTELSFNERDFLTSTQVKPQNYYRHHPQVSETLDCDKSYLEYVSNIPSNASTPFVMQSGEHDKEWVRAKRTRKEYRRVMETEGGSFTVNSCDSATGNGKGKIKKTIKEKIPQLQYNSPSQESECDPLHTYADSRESSRAAFRVQERTVSYVKQNESSMIHCKKSQTKAASGEMHCVIEIDLVEEGISVENSKSLDSQINTSDHENSYVACDNMEGSNTCGQEGVTYEHENSIETDILLRDKKSTDLKWESSLEREVGKENTHREEPTNISELEMIICDIKHEETENKNKETGDSVANSVCRTKERKEMHDNETDCGYQKTRKKKQSKSNDSTEKLSVSVCQSRKIKKTTSERVLTPPLTSDNVGKRKPHRKGQEHDIEVEIVAEERVKPAGTTCSTLASNKRRKRTTAKDKKMEPPLGNTELGRGITTVWCSATLVQDAKKLNPIQKLNSDNSVLGKQQLEEEEHVSDRKEHTPDRCVVNDFNKKHIDKCQDTRQRSPPSIKATKLFSDSDVDNCNSIKKQINRIIQSSALATPSSEERGRGIQPSTETVSPLCVQSTRKKYVEGVNVLAEKISSMKKSELQQNSEINTSDPKNSIVETENVESSSINGQEESIIHELHTVDILDIHPLGFCHQDTPVLGKETSTCHAKKSQSKVKPMVWCSTTAVQEVKKLHPTWKLIDDMSVLEKQQFKKEEHTPDREVDTDYDEHHIDECEDTLPNIPLGTKEAKSFCDSDMGSRILHCGDLASPSTEESGRDTSKNRPQPSTETVSSLLAHPRRKKSVEKSSNLTTTSNESGKQNNTLTDKKSDVERNKCLEREVGKKYSKNEDAHNVVSCINTNISKSEVIINDNLYKKTKKKKTSDSVANIVYQSNKRKEICDNEAECGYQKARKKKKSKSNNSTEKVCQSKKTKKTTLEIPITPPSTSENSGKRKLHRRGQEHDIEIEIVAKNRVEPAGITYSKLTSDKTRKNTAAKDEKMEPLFGNTEKGQDKTMVWCSATSVQEAKKCNPTQKLNSDNFVLGKQEIKEEECTHDREEHTPDRGVDNDLNEKHIDEYQDTQQRIPLRISSIRKQLNRLLQSSSLATPSSEENSSGIQPSTETASPLCSHPTRKKYVEGVNVLAEKVSSVKKNKPQDSEIYASDPKNSFVACENVESSNINGQGKGITRELHTIVLGKKTSTCRAEKSHGKVKPMVWCSTTAVQDAKKVNPAWKLIDEMSMLEKQQFKEEEHTPDKELDTDSGEHNIDKCQYTLPNIPLDTKEAKLFCDSDMGSRILHCGDLASPSTEENGRDTSKNRPQPSTETVSPLLAHPRRKKSVEKSSNLKTPSNESGKQNNTLTDKKSDVERNKCLEREVGKKYSKNEDAHNVVSCINTNISKSEVIINDNLYKKTKKKKTSDSVANILYQSNKRKEICDNEAECGYQKARKKKKSKSNNSTEKVCQSKKTKKTTLETQISPLSTSDNSGKRKLHRKGQEHDIEIEIVAKNRVEPAGITYSKLTSDKTRKNTAAKDEKMEPLFGNTEKGQDKTMVWCSATSVQEAKKCNPTQKLNSDNFVLGKQEIKEEECTHDREEHTPDRGVDNDLNEKHIDEYQDTQQRIPLRISSIRKQLNRLLQSSSLATPSSEENSSGIQPSTETASPLCSHPTRKKYVEGVNVLAEKVSSVKKNKPQDSEIYASDPKNSFVACENVESSNINGQGKGITRELHTIVLGKKTSTCRAEKSHVKVKPMVWCSTTAVQDAKKVSPTWKLIDEMSMLEKQQFKKEEHTPDREVDTDYDEHHIDECEDTLPNIPLGLKEAKSFCDSDMGSRIFHCGDLASPSTEESGRDTSKNRPQQSIETVSSLLAHPRRKKSMEKSSNLTTPSNECGQQNNTLTDKKSDVERNKILEREVGKKYSKNEDAHNVVSCINTNISKSEVIINANLYKKTKKKKKKKTSDSVVNIVYQSNKRKEICDNEAKCGYQKARKKKKSKSNNSTEKVCQSRKTKKTTLETQITPPSTSDNSGKRKLHRRGQEHDIEIEIVAKNRVEPAGITYSNLTSDKTRKSTTAKDEKMEPPFGNTEKGQGKTMVWCSATSVQEAKKCNPIQKLNSDNFVLGKQEIKEEECTHDREEHTPNRGVDNDLNEKHIDEYQDTQQRIPLRISSIRKQLNRLLQSSSLATPSSEENSSGIQPSTETASPLCSHPTRKKYVEGVNVLAEKVSSVKKNKPQDSEIYASDPKNSFVACENVESSNINGQGKGITRELHTIVLGKKTFTCRAEKSHVKVKPMVWCSTTAVQDAKKVNPTWKLIDEMSMLEKQQFKEEHTPDREVDTDSGEHHIDKCQYTLPNIPLGTKEAKSVSDSDMVSRILHFGDLASPSIEESGRDPSKHRPQPSTETGSPLLANPRRKTSVEKSLNITTARKKSRKQNMHSINSVKENIGFTENTIENNHLLRDKKSDVERKKRLEREVGKQYTKKRDACNVSCISTNISKSELIINDNLHKTKKKKKTSDSVANIVYQSNKRKEICDNEAECGYQKARKKKKSKSNDGAGKVCQSRKT